MSEVTQIKDEKIEEKQETLTSEQDTKEQEQSNLETEAELQAESELGAKSESETDSETAPEAESAPEEEPKAESNPKAEPAPEEATKPQTESEATQEGKPAKRKKHRWLWIPVGILVLLLLVYGGFVLYFSQHYFWGTRIAGADCSCMTVADAEELFQEKAREYSLTVRARGDIQETISAGEIAMEYPVQEQLEEIQKSQNPLLWIGGLFGDAEYAISENVIYDVDELQNRIAEMSIFSEENQEKPVSAGISAYSSQDKGYHIIEEIQGSVLLPEAEEEIAEAFLQMQDSVDLDEMRLYLAPGRDAEDTMLVRLVDRLNSYTHSRITYQFGAEAVILDGDRIHEWLSVRGSSVYLDKTAVREYVKELAEQHDTYYKEKEFTATDGTTRKLRSGYGWMIDVDAETEHLLEDLANGSVVEREPEYKRRGADYSENNIADSYVEIDLGHQHLYLYIEGSLILETDFVSGCMATGNGTPAGIYDLEYRTKNVVLRGPTWESYVNFWMPFNGAVGMHDATWRKEFGGDIYLQNGSHGCVNLPYNMAKQIYSYVYAGMPIICYY